MNYKKPFRGDIKYYVLKKGKLITCENARFDPEITLGERIETIFEAHKGDKVVLKIHDTNKDIFLTNVNPKTEKCGDTTYSFDARQNNEEDEAIILKDLGFTK